MRAVQFPEFDVNHIEIFIAEIIPVEVDLWLLLDIEQTFDDVGVLELTVGHLHVVLAIGDEEHPVYHTNRVPFLEFGGLLQKLEPRVDIQDRL